MVGKQHANHAIYLVILKIRDLDEAYLNLREWNVIRHIANWYIKINLIIIYCENKFHRLTSHDRNNRTQQISLINDKRLYGSGYGWRCRFRFDT